MKEALRFLEDVYRALSPHPINDPLLLPISSFGRRVDDLILDKAEMHDRVCTAGGVGRS